MIGAPVVLLAAMGLDALFGEPRWLWSRVAHPAVLMGGLIGWSERRFNKGQYRKLKGALALVLWIATAGVLGGLLAQLWVLELLALAILLAQKSLVDHVGDVASGLRYGLHAGRRAVARIVGRDVATLDEAGVARSAIESAAENFSDGVIAPIFWYLIAGLPGAVIYKMVNTADSMVGYKTTRHQDFGWASARLDDVLNWVPARLSAGLILLAQGMWFARALVGRDAPLHRSPNAGWPEAAMAVSLGVALSGPRSYEGEQRHFPFVFPEGRRALKPSDIDRACQVLWRSWAFVGVSGAILVWFIGTSF